MVKVLSLGAGRLWEKMNLEFEKMFSHAQEKIIINHVDGLYYFKDNTEVTTEKSESVFYSEDIFKFLETYPAKDIDHISAIRVFEHIPREKITYLLYLLKEVSLFGEIGRAHV